MNIPLSYNPVPIIQDEKGTCYVKVSSVTEIQIKSLSILRCICKESEQNSLPFFIENINSVSFHVRMDLAGMIALLSVFTKEPIIVVTNGKTKTLTKQSLTNFIFS